MARKFDFLSGFHRLKSAVLGLVFAAVAGSVPAPPPANYYQTINVQTGSALKAELRAIISGQRGYPVVVKSYDQIRDILLNDVDSVGSNNVKLFYTSEIRSASQWGTSINREHLWPQSYGVGSGPSNSDMHHVHLCDSGLNSSRGNDLFGNVNIGSATVYYPANAVNDRSYSVGSTFQVSNNRKGDAARAILYMDTRYSHLSLISTGQSLGSNQFGYLDQLLQWHNEDPVDAWETNRNDRVFFYQNNRNPYIDHPEWVALVYGGASSSAPSLSNFARVPDTPSSIQSVTVSVDATDPDGIASATLNYRIGTSGGFTPVSMTPSGATYSGVIPMQPADTLVQYYVQVNDTLANAAYAPLSGPSGPASYTVIGEFPVMGFLQTSPSGPTTVDAVHIRVNADDNGGVGALTTTAFWRVGATGSFTSIPMSITSGTTWQTNTPIPAQAEGVTVQYYVTSTDAGARTTTLPATAPGSPAAYTVEGEVPYIQATVANAVGKLMFSEACHRLSGQALQEMVEIVNYSNQGFILDNLMINDNGAGGDINEGYVKFPTGTTIEPYGIIVVLIRAEVPQSFVDTIPVTSNINGAPVKVFAVNGALTFNGNPVVAMTTGTGGAPQLSNGESIVLAQINLSDSSEEAFVLGDVIDGVGWGDSSPDSTSWGPTVSTTLAADNVAIGTGDGVSRNGPVDTDTKADWTAIAAGGPYTPGAVPVAFEIPDLDLVLTTNNLTLVEGGAAQSVGVHLASAPTGTVNVTVARTGGSTYATSFVINSGELLTFTPGNFSTNQFVTFAKQNDPDAVNDTATFQLFGTGVHTATVTLNETDTVSGVEDWSSY